MNLSDFSFSVPKELIATTPAEPRDSSRLLVINPPPLPVSTTAAGNAVDTASPNGDEDSSRQSEARIDARFRDLLDFLLPGDLLVFNNTRVIPAALTAVDPRGKLITINLLHQEAAEAEVCVAETVMEEVKSTDAENDRAEWRKEAAEELGSAASSTSEATSAAVINKHKPDHAVAEFSDWRAMIKGKGLQVGDILTLVAPEQSPQPSQITAEGVEDVVPSLSRITDDEIAEVSETIQVQVVARLGKESILRFPKPAAPVVENGGVRGETAAVEAAAESDLAVLNILEKYGAMPLPPYMKRPGNKEDKRHYQTVYAQEAGSVAAHTAGLHFTKEMLERIKQNGIETCYITLHIGAGTFAPIKTEDLAAHEMHWESYSISPAAAYMINQAKQNGRRVIAVGTTSMRALESAAKMDGGGGSGSAATWDCNFPLCMDDIKCDENAKIEKAAAALSGVQDGYDDGGDSQPDSCINEKERCEDEENEMMLRGVKGDDKKASVAENAALNGEAVIKPVQLAKTNIFIRPGHNFLVCDGLLTNFHMPLSTLFVLVCAFGGREEMMQAYQFAVDKRYRFFSYGDASLIFPRR